MVPLIDTAAAVAAIPDRQRVAGVHEKIVRDARVRQVVHRRRQQEGQNLRMSIR